MPARWVGISIECPLILNQIQGGSKRGPAPQTENEVALGDELQLDPRCERLARVLKCITHDIGVMRSRGGWGGSMGEGGFAWLQLRCES